LRGDRFRARSDDGDTPLQKGRERVEGRGVLAPDDVVRDAEPAHRAQLGRGLRDILLAHRDDAVGVRIGKLLEQRRVDDGKDRRRRADAERERCDGGGGEAGRAPQSANGVANVAPELLGHATAHFVARLLAPLLAPTLAGEIQHGRSSGVVGRHAHADVPLGGHVDVKRGLAVEARVELTGAAEAEDTADEGEQACAERHSVHCIARMSSTARDSRRHAWRSSASRARPAAVRE
jgi:hypothetical protein